MHPHWIVQQVAVQSGDTIFVITQKSRTSTYESEDAGNFFLARGVNRFKNPGGPWSKKSGGPLIKLRKEVA